MRKLLSILLLLTVALNPGVAKDNDDNGAIIAAAKSYVSANSAMKEVNATVEQVVDDFARVKVSPKETTGADPAWVFVKKKGGQWSGVTFGTSFTTEDYQQLGIPNALRVP